MTQLWKFRAGRTKGLRRNSSVYILAEFKTAVDRLAKELEIPRGVVVERALLAFMETLSNGTGTKALNEVAEVRQYPEADRATHRCAEVTLIRCLHDAVSGSDRCGHHQ